MRHKLPGDEQYIGNYALTSGEAASRQADEPTLSVQVQGYVLSHLYLVDLPNGTHPGTEYLSVYS